MSHRRLLIVGHDASLSGSPKVLRSIVRSLRARGDWDIEMVLGDGGPLTCDFAGPSSEARVLEYHAAAEARTPAERLLRLATARTQSRGAVLELGQYLRRRRLHHAQVSTAGYDCAYLNSTPSLHLVRDFDPDVPVVLHVHELGYWMRRSLDGDKRALLEIPRRYIAASTAVATYLTSLGIAPTRITVVPEFIDPLPVSPASSPVDNTGENGRSAPVVLGCGSFDWYKGADLFVYLAAAYTQRHPDLAAKFFWLGGQPDTEAATRLRAEVAKAGLGEVVRFEPPTDDPGTWFAAADVFAVTSRDDPFPLVALEAGAAGRPTLCFRNGGGISEYVDQGAGYVVPYADVSAMSDRIYELLSDSNARAAMGRRAAELVEAQYTTAAGIPKIEAVLESVLSPAAVW